MKSKYQGSGVPDKLKSEILVEILLPNSSIPAIAKKYNLSSATLYGWRSNHNRSINHITRKQESSTVPANNFIELLPEEVTPKLENQKLSEISLTFNNIALSINGNISTSSLTKMLNILELES
jgi:transposase-like protein